MTKAELRKLYLEKRAALSPAEVAMASRRIADSFFASVDLPPGGVLHTFIRIAKFNEIDTSVIYYRLWRDRPDVATVAPRTDLKTREIENVLFTGNSGLTENSWGIREPVDGVIIAVKDVDVVLVPLLCFDDNGNRVGYGKGMYDRFLAECRPDCKKVGVSLFSPVDEIDDVTLADVRLDMCITPDAVSRFDETTQTEPPLSAAP